jgi:hypothetical protein
MPVWAQILVAFIPLGTLAAVGIVRVESRLAHLEGQMAALLALFAANLTLSGERVSDRRKNPRFSGQGSPGGEG